MARKAILVNFDVGRWAT